MLLSHKTSVKVNDVYSNLIGHMCYAAYKLWNVCNYERHHYKEVELPEGIDYPDWYYQKKAHKDDLWYKQLPSQTAQEVCKLLDKSWKSFYVLNKTHGIENPNPPRYKHKPTAITYMQNGIAHDNGSDTVKLTISRSLKKYMSDTYDIHEDFIYLENQLFKSMDTIKQIKIYPPDNGTCDIIVVYEMKDIPMLKDNGKYLSIDLGIHNLMTCFNSETGETFIIGRKYLSICNYYAKEIAHVQSKWASIQSAKGIKYPKGSNHISRLYKKRNDTILDYLHKVTRYIVSYCKENNIDTVVIGDVKGIRKDTNFKSKTNQKLHALPYKKIYVMLEYKLALEGIILIRQKEAYSSQCSPLSPKVNKANATKNKRIKRGLYVDGNYSWNADVVGAYNILRLYLKTIDKTIKVIPTEIRNPYVVKVAV